MEKKYTLLLVPHTHWDREWYQPFQQFRMRLVALTDKLLGILDNDPRFAYFTFDGQTIVLEDYLEIRPEEREHLKKYIEQGRLLVGPWYILPDEFLVSGEATVRNLMLGHIIAEQFGRTMKAGHVPDPFGHISQMPQILNGFGIKSAFFMRGTGDEVDKLGSEFWWEAPDGSKVLACFMPAGYANACWLGHKWEDGRMFSDREQAFAHIRGQLEFLGPKASTRYLLLMNGSDHVEPQPELPDLIKYVNERLEGGEVMHSTLEEFAAKVLAEKPKLGTHRGELRGSKTQALLPGVLSTRMYLKQANERTQTLLEKWAEPTSALAWLFGKPYESSFLWNSWKLCLQNHPHDSICGCSIDQVHREMMPRFDQSQQIAQSLTDVNLAHLAEQIDTRPGKGAAEGAQSVVVWNALSWPVTDIARVPVSRHLAEGQMPPHFAVRDAKGNLIPCQLANERIAQGPRQRTDWHAEVCFIAEKVPAVGYRVYSIEEAKGPCLGMSEVSAAGSSIETGLLSLDARADGSFELYLKNGVAYLGPFNRFVDTEDAGDEYNSSIARQSQAVTPSESGKVSVVADGPVFATIRVDLTLDLPRSLTEDRMARTRETVACTISTWITAYHGVPRVDVVTELENNAKDHRLRALFTTEVPVTEAFAEGQFCVVERDAGLPPADGWIEKPVRDQPQQSFVSTSGKEQSLRDEEVCSLGVTLINQGLPVYEVAPPADPDFASNLALTLLRSVGWLCRDDHVARPFTVGPVLETPEAQCLGKHTFKYAVYPHVGDWIENRAWQQAHQHNVPLVGTIVAAHKGKLPNEMSFFNVEPAEIVISALKKAEKSDDIILRVYNITPKRVTAKLSAFKPIKLAVLTNLNEEDQGKPLGIDEKGGISFPMPGSKIQTVKLSL